MKNQPFLLPLSLDRCPAGGVAQIKGLPSRWIERLCLPASRSRSQLYPSFLDLVHSRYSQGDSQGQPSQELRSIPKWLTSLTTLEASLLSILHLTQHLFLPLFWQGDPGGGVSVHGPPIMLAYISHHGPGHITFAEGSHGWPLKVDILYVTQVAIRFPGQSFCGT